MQSVDSATVRGRRLSLPQEICPVSLRRLRMPRGILTAGQKSAEGVLGYVVGKASEALHAERRSQQIGRAGNGDRRPEREERQVGHESRKRQAAEHPVETGLLVGADEKSSLNWMFSRLSLSRFMSYLPLLSFGPSVTVPGSAYLL